MDKLSTKPTPAVKPHLKKMRVLKQEKPLWLKISNQTDQLHIRFNGPWGAIYG